MEGCPKDAIILQYNRFGELVPKIDKSKCVECNLCKEKCQINSKVNLKEPKICFAAWRKNFDKRKRSASGGVASVLAEKILKKNGILYSAILEESQDVSICRITDRKDLTKIQGSKYVYSYTNRVFKLIKQDLERGRKVLYMGLPCQVAGLYSFLGNRDYAGLITVDIICHGTVSQKIWKTHVKYLTEKYDMKRYDNFSFRSNIEDENYHLCFHMGEKTILNLWNGEDSYFTNFLNGSILKDNCYFCQYKRRERIGDITIGDFIGLGEDRPFGGDKGNTSVIFINSEKGRQFTVLDNEELQLIERDKNEAISNGPSLSGNINKRKYKRIFKMLYTFLGSEKSLIGIKIYVKGINKLCRMLHIHD